MLETIIKGQWMMGPLMGCSVVALMVIIDRAWAFWEYSRVDVRSLRAKIRELVPYGRFEEAARLCANTPGPVSAVLLSGLQAYARHRQRTDNLRVLSTVMEKAMDDYAEHALAAVEKRFNVLSSVVTVAPLLGMTGTVTGMISAFAAMSAGGVTNEAVANGISEALITTATGLIIAVIAFIPFSYFRSLSRKIDLDVEESSSELIDLVAAELEVTSRPAA